MDFYEVSLRSKPKVFFRLTLPIQFSMGFEFTAFSPFNQLKSAHVIHQQINISIDYKMVVQKCDPTARKEIN